MSVGANVTVGTGVMDGTAVGSLVGCGVGAGMGGFVGHAVGSGVASAHASAANSITTLLECPMAPREMILSDCGGGLTARCVTALN